MAFDEVYDRVTEAFPEVETIVADSAYKTPHICKKVFEDGRVLSTAYKRPQTYFHHSWPPFMATFQHLFHHLLLILPLMNEKAQLLLDFFDRLGKAPSTGWGFAGLRPAVSFEFTAYYK